MDDQFGHKGGEIWHIKTLNLPCDKLLRKVLRARGYFSTAFGFVAVFHQTRNLSRNKCRHLGSIPSKSTNQFAAFLQPATNVFVALQVDPARWNTWNVDPKLVVQQVEDFCIIFCRLKQPWQFFRAYTSHLWNGGSGCPDYGKIWENQPEATKSR